MSLRHIEKWICSSDLFQKWKSPNICEMIFKNAKFEQCWTVMGNAKLSGVAKLSSVAMLKCWVVQSWNRKWKHLENPLRKSAPKMCQRWTCDQKGEQLLSASKGHDSSPQTHRKKRSNTQPAWRAVQKRANLVDLRTCYKISLYKNRPRSSALL